MIRFYIILIFIAISRSNEKIDAPNFVGFVSEFPQSKLTVYLSPPSFSIDKRSPYLISLRRRGEKGKCHTFVYDCPGCRKSEAKFTKGIQIKCRDNFMFIYNNSDLNKITIAITDPLFVVPYEKYKLNAQIHNGLRWGDLLTTEFTTSQYKAGPPTFLNFTYNFDLFIWKTLLKPPLISNGQISQYQAAVTSSASNKCFLWIYDCPSCRLNGSLGTHGLSLKICNKPIINETTSTNLNFILFWSSDKSFFKPGKSYSLEIQAVNGWGMGDILTKNITLSPYKSSSPQLSNIIFLDNKLELTVQPPLTPNGQISKYIVVIKTGDDDDDADDKCVKIWSIKCIDCSNETVGTNGEPSISDENKCFNVTILEYEFQTLVTNIKLSGIDDEYFKFTKYKLQVQAGNAWGWGEPSNFYKLTSIPLYRKIPIIQLSLSFVIILIIVLCVVLLRRRRLHNINKNPSDNVKREKYDSDLVSMDTVIVSRKIPSVISLKQFGEYFRVISGHNFETLLTEFKILTKGTNDPMLELELTTNAGNANVNVNKNRYINIVPYDQSRVLIHNKSYPKNYINASYIPFEQEEGIEYIAGQGPTESSIDDFWQMIWEQNVSIVVMLTKTCEGSVSKCMQYWPNDVDSMIYVKNKEIQVTLVSEKTTSSHIEREMRIFNSKFKEIHNLTQLHMDSWLDFTAPNLECFDNFLFRFHQIATILGSHPFLIHSSAGVGRTGTMISIDRLVKQLVNGSQEVDIYKTVLNLRRYRCNMVQRPAQYIFIHEYINHFLNIYMKNEENDQIYFNE